MAHSKQHINSKGKTVIEPGDKRTLSVESILPLDGEIEETAAVTEGFPFWSSLSLEELAEQQKVSPVEDLDELSALWPVDDDPDKLMDHILSDRSAYKMQEPPRNKDRR